MAWWALAGVDTAVSERPVNWLRPVMPRDVPHSAPARATAPAFPSSAPASEIPAPESLPGNLEEFQSWLAESKGLYEAGWAGSRVLPAGPANAPLMIIGDMPDPEDEETGTLLSGDAGRLLDAMLAAIGLDRDRTYLASLSLTRFPGGMFDEADGTALALRMRHHIHLAAPRRVLLLGERTSRFLLPTNGPGMQPGLRILNHQGGTVEAVVVPHPRLLLRQPEGKAQSWHALQYLIEDIPA